MIYLSFFWGGVLCRDASWELEANAYSELLEVYNHCDSVTCLCNEGRTYSKKGYIMLCLICEHKNIDTENENLYSVII